MRERAALEVSKEGRHFLDLVAKCTDLQLRAALIAAGARLLTIGENKNESALPASAGPDFTSALVSLKGLSFLYPRYRGLYLLPCIPVVRAFDRPKRRCDLIRSNPCLQGTV